MYTFTLKLQAMYMSNDPNYLSCNKHKCKNECIVRTCSGTLTFHVINIRTDIKFVLYSGGFKTPCILGRSGPFNFANPKKPDVEQTAMSFLDSHTCLKSSCKAKKHL